MIACEWLYCPFVILDSTGEGLGLDSAFDSFDVLKTCLDDLSGHIFLLFGATHTYCQNGNNAQTYPYHSKISWRLTGSVKHIVNRK